MRRLATLLVLALAAGSCGSGDIEVPTTATSIVPPVTGPTTMATAPTTTEPETESHDLCAQSLVAGSSQMECEGMSFDIGIPETCMEGGCGVIVDVHGYGSSGAEADDHTDLQRLGNDAGYVVVQPNSPGYGWDYEADAPRIRSFLDQLIEAANIDRGRVHIGGMSQGGYMTWVFVCDHADLIASAAPLSGDEGQEMWCGFVTGSPSQQVDILLVHGRNDPLVPFGTALAYRDTVIDAWEMTESGVLQDESTYRWTRWSNSAGTVFELLEFDWEGGNWGGHCYPGAPETERAGCGTDTPIHYGEAALEFYIAHPKDE